MDDSIVNSFAKMAINFNGVARFYNFSEKFFFGNLLDRSRNRFLNYCTKINSILILGEGCGQFLIELLRVNEFCEVSIIESSSEMICIQKCLLLEKDIDRVSFHCIPIDELIVSKSFDLICTHFFWDCFSYREISTFLPYYTKLLKKDGIWLNSDFVDSDNRLLHADFLKIRLMYWFFRITTGIRARKVEPFYHHAIKNSLQLIDHDEIRSGFIKSEVFKKSLN
ncbi:MAG: class I SAM-dependent methyltransferase [Opitutae bacterium]|nr:class I SAM-dependent methyltransferase [Opitutae bacterium]MBT5717679.1 class I SAM-dependent methyltransferase [Opitutae bacterium]